MWSEQNLNWNAILRKEVVCASVELHFLFSAVANGGEKFRHMCLDFPY